MERQRRMARNLRRRQAEVEVARAAVREADLMIRAFQGHRGTHREVALLALDLIEEDQGYVAEPWQEVEVWRRVVFYDQQTGRFRPMTP